MDGSLKVLRDGILIKQKDHVYGLNGSAISSDIKSGKTNLVLKTNIKNLIQSGSYTAVLNITDLNGSQSLEIKTDFEI